MVLGNSYNLNQLNFIIIIGLTIMLQDYLKSFTALHILALAVKIGPEHMTIPENTKVKNHTALNMAGLSILAGMFLFSVNILSPNEITFGVSILSAILALLIIGVIGVFVNLATPSQNNFADANIASSNANKWGSYLILCLFVVLLSFFFINGVSALFFDGMIAIPALRAGGWGINLPIFITVAASSFLGTAVVYYLCRRSGKILDTRAVAIRVFLITNFVCGTILYAFNFVLFR